MLIFGGFNLHVLSGRFRHPKGVHPGLVAKLVCRLFHPTSSLATACGMQVNTSHSFSWLFHWGLLAVSVEINFVENIRRVSKAIDLDSKVK